MQLVGQVQQPLPLAGNKIRDGDALAEDKGFGCLFQGQMEGSCGARRAGAAASPARWLQD